MSNNFGIKTNFTLEYLNNYLKSNNIEVPKDIDLGAIFNKCDTHDQNDYDMADGILDLDESKEFFDEVFNYGNLEFSKGVLNCKKEVMEKQKTEEQEYKANVLNNPPTSYDNRGLYGDESIDYIMFKLESKGIKVSDMDFDVLEQIINSFDYDLDSDLNMQISTKDAYAPASEYMNKDENGNIVDTHVLDWIVNRYLEKTK